VDAAECWEVGGACQGAAALLYSLPPEWECCMQLPGRQREGTVYQVNNSSFLWQQSMSLAISTVQTVFHVPPESD